MFENTRHSDKCYWRFGREIIFKEVILISRPKNIVAFDVISQIVWIQCIFDINQVCVCVI